jgi:hypothetical protein
MSHSEIQRNQRGVNPVKLGMIIKQNDAETLFNALCLAL